MQEIRQPSMPKSRFLFFFLRVLLLLLGGVLVWRMTSVMWYSDGPNLSKELHDGPKVNPILVEVFYESMCPDSKYFIKHQLVPTVEKIPEIVDFRLIPYGKAHTVENSTGIFFSCQHLENECVGNKIHACAIKYTTNQGKLLGYASCLFNNLRNPQAVGESCAKEMGIDWEIIKKCSVDKEGSELLKSYGEETHRLDPPVSFIPTILINKSQENQKNILKDLLAEVCSKYKETKPASCP